jgi:hypothetical protein
MTGMPNFASIASRVPQTALGWTSEEIRLPSLEGSARLLVFYVKRQPLVARVLRHDQNVGLSLPLFFLLIQHRCPHMIRTRPDATHSLINHIGMLTLGQVLLLALAETNPFFLRHHSLTGPRGEARAERMATGAPPEAARDLAGRLERRDSARSARQVRVAGDVAR